MAGAGLFAVAGYAWIVAAHVQADASQFGLDTSTIRTIHVWCGYSCLAWLGVQTVAGVLKRQQLELTGQRAYTWHGDSGKLLLGAAYVTMALGFWCQMNYTSSGWNWQLKVSLTALAGALLGLRALPAAATTEPVKPVVGQNEVTPLLPVEK